MFINNSPWLKQLARTRPVAKGKMTEQTDIAIIGGGIAGVTTAYFTLLFTDKKVTLIEADKIAHGATGHNAGQVTSYFEAPFQDFVKKYGLELAAHAQRAIEFDARILLNEIIRDAQLLTPKSEFEGYNGLETKEQILISLEDLFQRGEAVIATRALLISKEWHEHIHLPEKYKPYYSIVDKENILSLLETIDDRYIACLPFLSGCMNSALFTEELVGFLMSTYKERFTLLEETLVEDCILSQNEARLKSGTNEIHASRVVLCTNGFEKITLKNQSGSDIDTKFHHSVTGLIGYMAGFLDVPDQKPAASIYSKTDSDTGEAYYYATRRPYEHLGGKYNILSVGGPEEMVEDTRTYDPKMPYPEKHLEFIFSFIKKTFSRTYERSAFYFAWHGLMGYTPNGVRLIGSEPCNPILMYNLGCNGVGILPSIYGGHRIARILRGDTIEPSIFDPQDQRCPT